MANPEHLAKLREGVEAWNDWRAEYAGEVDLSEANLGGRNLDGAILDGAELDWTTLDAACLANATLRFASLHGAKLRGANLSGSNLTGAMLAAADLSRANLSSAILGGAVLLRANLSGAHLSGCLVYGVSAWGVIVDQDTVQSDLVITMPREPAVTVDDIEVAQFIYLLLNNDKVRGVIDTITSKVVLILGRFTEGRKPVLDALRHTLRARNYSPVLFDFAKPESRDFTETIRTLAGMARFVVADITDAKSIPQELMAVVPDFPSVPVQPLLLASQREYGMFEDFRRYPWVLDLVPYDSQEQLIEDIEPLVITPAERWLERERPRA